MPIRSLLPLFLLTISLPVVAQASFTGEYYQSFDGIGTAPRAELPEGWRVDRLPGVDQIGDYDDGRTRTDARGGNFFGQDAPVGVINFGSGPAASASERSVGFASDGSFGSGVLYVRFRNDTGAPIGEVWYASSRETYRGGADEAEAEASRYSSVDGQTWVRQGIGRKSGGLRDGYPDAPAPGFSRSISKAEFGVPVEPGDDFYIGFLYSTSGPPITTVPVLAFDDFGIALTSGGLSAIFPNHGERVFGDVPVGQMSEPQRLRANVVEFGGSTPADVEITGPHASDFAAERFFGDDFWITFTPSGPGLREATLRFVANGVESRPVALRGGVEAPAPRLRLAAELRDGVGPIPDEGGRYRYKVLARTDGPADRTLELWADLVFPNGHTLPALRPETVTIPAGELWRTAASRRVRGSWPAGTYTHRVYLGTYPDEVEAEASFTVEKVAAGTAQVAGLEAPAEGPNPFRDRTTVWVGGLEAGPVRAELFDAVGRRVRVLYDGEAPAGGLEVVVDGRSLPAGVYVVRVVSGDAVEARTVVRAR